MVVKANGQEYLTTSSFESSQSQNCLPISMFIAFLNYASLTFALSRKFILMIYGKVLYVVRNCSSSYAKRNGHILSTCLFLKVAIKSMIL